MREVAERAGVAMSSVSRVLSGHPDVSPAMSEKVMQAVAELDYQPDMLAQSLRRRETHTVGFVVGDISNPLFAEIVTGVESTLHSNGYSMLLTNSLGDPLLEAAHISPALAAAGRRPRDLGAGRDEPRDDRQAGELDIPIVVLDRSLPQEMTVSRVLSDHRSGMKAATLHLLDLGHRRIALIGGTGGQARARAAGGARGGVRLARPAGRPTSSTKGSMSVEQGVAAMRGLLDLPEPPTAVIAGGNQLMLGALRTVSERGVTLGRELSFVGCDDVAITDLFQPAVAVVRRDNFAMGRAAAELLLGPHARGVGAVGCRPPDGVRRAPELRRPVSMSRTPR